MEKGSTNHKRYPMKYLLIILILATAACNPVKQVLKSQEKTEKVVQKYMADHPSKPDTVHLAGRDTILVRQSVKIDTIPLPYPVKERYTETITRDRVIHDTLVITKCDGLEAVQKQVKELTDRLDRAEEKAGWWQKACLITWGILVVAVGAFIFLKLR